MAVFFVMDDPLGFTHRFLTHALAEHLVVLPQCWRASGALSHPQIACGCHLPAYQASYRGRWESARLAQTWVKLDYVPRKASTDQPDEAADPALLELSSGLRCWKIQLSDNEGPAADMPAKAASIPPGDSHQRGNPWA